LALVIAHAGMAESGSAQEPAALAAPVSAVAAAAPIEGVFLLDSLAGDRVEDIIGRGVGLLSWYKRPFARGRLRETTKPAVWVSIEPNPGALRIRTEVHDLTIPWDGELLDWEWKPGDPVDVSAEWAGGELLQDFHGSDGSRYNRYVLSADGRVLELNVRIESDQLSEPLRYRLVYVNRDET
jgi:hypothetical protein